MNKRKKISQRDIFEESKENNSLSVSQIPVLSVPIGSPKRSVSVSHSQNVQEKRRALSQLNLPPQSCSSEKKLKKPCMHPPSVYEDSLLKSYGISSLIECHPSCNHGQEFSCTRQGHLSKRRSWSCLPKQHSYQCLRKSSLPLHPSYSKEDRSVMPNGYKIPSKDIEQLKASYAHETESKSVEKVLIEVKPKKWNKYSNISVVSLLVLMSGVLGALCFAFIGQHYFTPKPFQSTEISATDTISGASLNSLLKNYMQSVAEELRSIKEEIGRTKEVVCANHAVEVSRPRDILEELFTSEADLACAGNLGSVLATPDTTTISVYTQFTLMGLFSLNFDLPYHPPDTVIKGLIQEVGDCWAFSGQTGRLVVALHRPCLVTGVSLSHIPPTVTPSGNIASAPKHFIVMAHRSEDDFENGVQLGKFEYNSKGPWRQRFKIDSEIMKEHFRAIEFKFVNNQGNSDYTCVYRVHVHGIIS